MAMTATLYKETAFLGKRAKVYKLTSDGSDTAVDVTPGDGYTIGPIGNYTGYTYSAGTFTITLPAGTNASLRYVMFLEP